METPTLSRHQVYEHDLASMGAAGEADCSPDEAWEFLAPRLLPSGDWDRTSPDPLRQRVDSDIMELVSRLGPDPANHHPEAMLRSPDGQRAAGGSEQPAESLNLAERLEFRPGYRFKDAEGGRGGTPLHQCMLLDTPASLLALRYLLFRWPGLVYDSYGLGPYAGEHLLHMAIVKKSHNILYFIEKHVRGGLKALQWLGNRSLHHWWEEYERAQQRSLIDGLVAPRASKREPPGIFFHLGSSCYFGGYPLSFAAATGSCLWTFMYLVQRLRVNIDAADGPPELGGRRNTALHMAVISCKSESYRYLKSLGAREDIPNADNLKPMELAALLGKRCTQQKLPAPDESTPPAICSFPERADEMQPDDVDSNSVPTMFEFILKLRQQTRWFFGNVSSVDFPVDELHGPLACSGNSVLMIACRAEKLQILCPKGAVGFVRMTGEENTNAYEAADTNIDLTFKFPHKPGVQPPPVESTLLLVLAEYLWNGFGRRLLVTEMCLCYVPWLGLLTFVTVSRGTLDDVVQTSRNRGDVIDGILLLLTVLMLLLQCAKLWRREFVTLDYWNPLKQDLFSIKTGVVDAAFIGSLTGACSLTIAALIVRFLDRQRSGWTEGVTFPVDAELFAVANVLGYFYALYYLRCFEFFGALAIIVIEMLAQDIVRILVIYTCFLVGFAIAFHVILYADPQCAIDDCADPFKSVQDSLLATMMMTIGEWLLRLLSILYIICCNILLVNLLIALLNDTFTTIAERTVQKHAIDRTNVVLQLEKLSPLWLRKRFYNQFLMKVKSDVPTAEWEWDDSKHDEHGRKQKLYFKRFLNIERTGLPEDDDGILLALGASRVDEDYASQILDANKVVSHEQLRRREKLIDPVDMRDGIARVLKEFDGYVVTEADTLVVCDLQEDYVSGPLAVADAASCLGACNEAIAFFQKRGALVVFTQTCKPEDHCFFESEVAKRPRELENSTVQAAAEEAEPAPPVGPPQYERFRAEDMPYGRQTVWPKHCVVATSGCQFDRGVYIPENAVVVRKGHRKHVDCHSAFFDNDRCSRTGLEEYITARHVPKDPKAPMPPGKPGRLFVIGLAYDHCVRHTAEDARAISRAAFQSEHARAAERAAAAGRAATMRKKAVGLVLGGVGGGSAAEDAGERPRPRIGWGDVVVLEDCTRLVHRETPEALQHMRDRLAASGVKVVPRGMLPVYPPGAHPAPMGYGMAPQSPYGMPQQFSPPRLSGYPMTPGQQFQQPQPYGGYATPPPMPMPYPQQAQHAPGQPPFPQPQFGAPPPPLQPPFPQFPVEAPAPPPQQQPPPQQPPQQQQPPSPPQQQQVPPPPQPPPPPVQQIPGLDPAPPTRSLREQLGRTAPPAAAPPGQLNLRSNAAFDPAAAGPQAAAPAGAELADARSGWRTNPTSQ